MTMTRALVAVLVGLLVGMAYTAWGQTPAPTLPPLAQCEVDRVALQDQVVALRAQLVALQTQVDREALARERVRIEGTLPTVEGQRWDWATLRYVPVPPEKTP